MDLNVHVCMLSSSSKFLLTYRPAQTWICCSCHQGNLWTSAHCYPSPTFPDPLFNTISSTGQTGMCVLVEDRGSTSTVVVPICHLGNYRFCNHDQCPLSFLLELSLVLQLLLFLHWFRLLPPLLIHQHFPLL